MRLARHRLYVSMGASSILFLALLNVPVNLGICVEHSCAESPVQLIVQLEEHETEPAAGFADDRRTIGAIERPEALLDESMPTDSGADEQEGTSIDHESMPTDSIAGQREGTSIDPVKRLSEAAPERDWSAFTENIAKEVVDSYFKQEESRAQMWQQTRSVMFQPGISAIAKVRKNALAKEGELLLSDLRFKRRVVGLGITIGYCFIGLPIFGVPVEERNPYGLTLFVCGYDT